ncbi:MAG: YjbQ family protein, partial [Thermodesulfobacteriota bacterium]
HEPISQYRHSRTGEDNGDARLKRQAMGREAVVAITDGELDFGQWEQITYGLSSHSRIEKSGPISRWERCTAFNRDVLPG